MNPKLAALIETLQKKQEELLSKLGSKIPFLGKFFNGVGRTVVWTKYAILISFSVVIILIVGTIIYFNVRPIDTQTKNIVAWMNSRIDNGGVVDIARLSWSFQPLSLSLGLKVENLTLKNYSHLESYFCPEMDVQVQPLKALTAKIPVHLSCSKGLARFGKLKSDKPFAFPEALWLKKLRITGDFSDYQIEISPELLGYSAINSRLSLENSHLEFRLSGLPGSFDFDLKVGTAMADLGEGDFVANGPVAAQLEGYFKLANGEPVGIQAEKFNLDFDQWNFKESKLFEKTAGLKLNAHLPFLMLIENRVPKSIELIEASMKIDALDVDIGGQYSFEAGSGSLRTNIPRAEVKGLRLPVVGLRHSPVTGIVEINSDIQFFPRQQPQGTWRLFFNNVRVKPKILPHVLDRPGQRDVLVSLASEGNFKSGIISTPRLELHVNATESDFYLVDGYLHKPLNDPMELLFKAEVSNDKLMIQKFGIKIHSLQAEGIGSIENVSNLFNREKEGDANLKINFNTNRIRFADWAGYFPSIKTMPVEGIFELSAAAEGPVNARDDWSLERVSWVVNRATLSKITGVFDSDLHQRLGLPDSLGLKGPFDLDFMFQGRGLGSKFDQANLIGHLDLSKLSFRYMDKFKKPADIPFRLDLSATASRNRVRVMNSRFDFNGYDVDVSGDLVQGSDRNFLEVSIPRPIELSRFRTFFPSLGKTPLSGLVKWDGRFVLYKGDPERSTIDWCSLGLDGKLDLENVRGIGEWQGKPLQDLNGHLRFQSTDITTSDLRGRWGENPWSASFILKRGQENGGTLSAFFGHGAFDFNGQIKFTELNIDGLPLDSFIHRSMIDKDMRASKANLVLTSKHARWGTLGVKDFMTKLTWNGQLLSADPVQMQSGGLIRGKTTLDFLPYYEQASPSQMKASFEFKDVNLEKPLPARWKGSIELKSSGKSLVDHEKSLEARYVGRMEQAEWKTFSDQINEKFSSLVGAGKIPDYLRDPAKAKECFSGKMSGDVEVTYQSQEYKFQTSLLKFASQSELKLSGKIGADQYVELKATVKPGDSCWRGSARSCFQLDESDRAAQFSVYGDVQNPRLTIDQDKFAKAFVHCASTQTKLAVETELKSTKKKRANTKSQDLIKKGL